MMEPAVPIEVPRGAREVRGENVERRAHQSTETHDAHVWRQTQLSRVHLVTKKSNETRLVGFSRASEPVALVTYPSEYNML